MLHKYKQYKNIILPQLLYFFPENLPSKMVALEHSVCALKEIRKFNLSQRIQTTSKSRIQTNQIKFIINFNSSTREANYELSAILNLRLDTDNH